MRFVFLYIYHGRAVIQRYSYQFDCVGAQGFMFRHCHAHILRVMRGVEQARVVQ